MVRENVLRVRERISAACLKVKRDPVSVTLIAVSKGRSAGQIREAVAAGICDIGENRVQEVLLKSEELKTSKPELPSMQLHMLGHLQTNKVKDAVRIFDLIHSVDSLGLAREIDRQAAKIGKTQDILIEVKTSHEPSKSGVRPEEASALVKEISVLKNVSVKGLMTIAPLVDNPEGSRPYFRMMNEIIGRINKLRVAGEEIHILSMGMTDDFEVAIEEGSTMVRIGRAIFEH